MRVPKKTTEVARDLGIPLYTLQNWLRAELVMRPQKDSSGDFVWTDIEIAAARAVVRARYGNAPPRRRRVAAQQQAGGPADGPTEEQVT